MSSKDIHTTSISMGLDWKRQQIRAYLSKPNGLTLLIKGSFHLIRELLQQDNIRVNSDDLMKTITERFSHVIYVKNQEAYDALEREHNDILELMRCKYSRGIQ